MRTAAPAFAAILCLHAGAAVAQPAAPPDAGLGPGSPPPAACAGAPSTPPGLAGWSGGGALRSAASPDATKAALLIGRGAQATLHPAARVTFAASPQKPPFARSYGGVLGLKIADAGVYRIATSTGAWIDVLDGPIPVRSIAHAPGPPCTTVHKTVDFKLHPGRYLVQLSSVPEASLHILVAPRP